MTFCERWCKNLRLLLENKWWFRLDSHFMKKLSTGMLLSNTYMFTFNQDSKRQTPTLYFDLNNNLGGSSGSISQLRSHRQMWTRIQLFQNARERCSEQTRKAAETITPPTPSFKPVANSSSYIRGWDTLVPDLMWLRPDSCSSSARQKMGLHDPLWQESPASKGLLLIFFLKQVRNSL